MPSSSTLEQRHSAYGNEIPYSEAVDTFVSGYNGLGPPTIEQYDQATALRSQLRERREGSLVYYYGPGGEHIPAAKADLLAAGSSDRWRPDAAGRYLLRKAVRHRPSEEIDPEVLEDFLDRYGNFQDEADLSMKFASYQREALQRLTLANALEARTKRKTSERDSRGKRLTQALGAAALGLVDRARRWRRGGRNDRPGEGVVSEPTDQEHRRSRREQQPADVVARREKHRRQAIAAGVVAALGASAILIALGVKGSGEHERGPTPVPIPSRTTKPSPTTPPSPSPTIASSPEATPSTSPSPSTSPKDKPSTDGGYTVHPRPADVLPGERPWNTLQRLGVPGDLIMHDLGQAARRAGVSYEWYGHGKYRWIEVNGHSGTRHVISALGKYITIPS